MVGSFIWLPGFCSLRKRINLAFFLQTVHTEIYSRRPFIGPIDDWEELISQRSIVKVKTFKNRCTNSDVLCDLYSKILKVHIYLTWLLEQLIYLFKRKEENALMSLLLELGPIFKFCWLATHLFWFLLPVLLPFSHFPGCEAFPL